MFAKTTILAVVALAACVSAIGPYEGNPDYQFQYAVDDPVSGDRKSQQETRQGDSVTGSYSLVEADGTLRTVNYAADPVGGFRAEVSKTPGGAGAPPPLAGRAFPVPRPVPVPVPVPTARYLGPAPYYGPPRPFAAPFPVPRPVPVPVPVPAARLLGPAPLYGGPRPFAAPVPVPIPVPAPRPYPYY